MSDSSLFPEWLAQIFRRRTEPPAAERTTVRLIVDAGHPTAELSLFDANFSLAARGVGGLDTSVQPGLYELQSKAGRSVQEMNIRVPPDKREFRVVMPSVITRTSAVPDTASDKGRAIADWVAEASRRAHLDLGRGGELFMLVRHSGGGERAITEGVFDLQLKDSRGVVVADFGTHARIYDDSARAVTIALAPGTYVLSAAAGSTGRLEQSIYVARDWQTQVLLSSTAYGQERSQGADLRRGAVLMSQRGRGADLSDPAVGWVEAAKVALFARTSAAPVSELRRAVNEAKEIRRDNAGLPSDAPLDSLLAAKFTNPMLGILGAHLLLLQEPLDRDLLVEVAINLEALVPGHPDVLALRHAASLPIRGTFVVPPMLRSSWQMILERSIEEPDVIPAGSYATAIATRTWGGGAWLIWKEPRQESSAVAAPAPSSAGATAATRDVGANTTTELIQQLLEKLTTVLPGQSVDRYLTALAASLSLNAAETRVLRYLAGVAEQGRVSSELLTDLSGNLSHRLFSSVYGLFTGRHLPDEQQQIEWLTEARDRYVDEASIVSALGLPKRTLTTAVEHLSILFKGELLMAPRICFDRILPKDLNKVRPSSPIPGAQTRAAFEIAKLWDVGQTLRIRFTGGTAAQRAIVEQFAPQWAKHANLKFKFSNDQNAEIRISFVESDGAWSYIGKDCLDIPVTQPTMNLGWQDEGVVLHEFGHAIGLIHEHQNPVGGIQWNKPAVYADLGGPPNFWDTQTVDNNMFATYGKDQINGTSLDKLSIMLYEIPQSWTTNGFSSKANDTLSETDKKFAGNQCNYPFNGPRKQPCT